MRVAMIDLKTNLPISIEGFLALGQVTENDYESVLMPAVEDKLKQQGKVRVLYRVGPTFTGFSAGVMWGDAKVGITHLNAWEKFAIVTDVEWFRSTIGIFQFAMRCPFKIFPNGQYAEAEKWIEAYADHDLVIVEQMVISLDQLNTHE